MTNAIATRHARREDGATSREARWLEWQAGKDAVPFYERLGLVGDPCPDPTHPYFEIDLGGAA